MLRRRLRLEVGEALVTERSKCRDLFVHVRKLAAYDGIVDAAGLAGEVDESGDRRLLPGDTLHPEPAALVCERAHRHSPAVVQLTDQVVARDERVGEEDLGEVDVAGEV